MTSRSTGVWPFIEPSSRKVAPAGELLTHETGLPNIMNNNTGALVGDGEQAAWTKVQTMPMEFAPGERFSYSQTNYVVLGRIIETLTGKPFRELLAERQFRVVGMPRTAQAGFGDSHDVIPGGARGYTFFRATPGGDLRTTDTLHNVFEEFEPSMRTPVPSNMSSTAAAIGAEAFPAPTTRTRSNSRRW